MINALIQQYVFNLSEKRISVSTMCVSTWWRFNMAKGHLSYCLNFLLKSTFFPHSISSSSLILIMKEFRSLGCCSI